jgi:hypothetical protein
MRSGDRSQNPRFSIDFFYLDPLVDWGADFAATPVTYFGGLNQRRQLVEVPARCAISTQIIEVRFGRD